ncbi:uncharacterized protein [Hoplias malabaricus]|uniref:uncharacterized protein n=1 Tax=Hoplias malabaricus TaxID=27720 RepID=UPI0034633746
MWQLYTFLAMICLVISDAKVLPNTTVPPARNMSPSLNSTTMDNSNANETTSSSPAHPPTTKPVTTEIKSTPVFVPNQPKPSIELQTSTSKTPKTTQSPTHAKGSSTIDVVTAVLLILVLLIFVFLLYRWYTRNPHRRTFRGLLESIVESGQQAWATVMGCLQRPQKQVEGVEDEEEDEEEEEEEEEKDVVVVVNEGASEGEKTEGAAKGEVEKKQEDDSDSETDSDSSLNDYSVVSASNLTEDEKKVGDGEKEEEAEEAEELTSVTLEEEEKEKAEPGEGDDLTPL